MTAQGDLPDGDATLDVSTRMERAVATGQCTCPTECPRRDDGGITLPNVNELLAAYLDGQSGVAHLRGREMPAYPWPDAENPMLSYLVDRAEEIAITDGHAAATVWLAVHAWFEGPIDALALPLCCEAHFVRGISGAPRGTCGDRLEQTPV